MSTPATGRVAAQFSGARRAAAPLERRPLEGRGPTPRRACGACQRTRNAPPRPRSIPGDITVQLIISRRLMRGSCTASKGSSRMAAAQQLVAARLPRVPTASSTPRIARDAPTPRHRPPSRRRSTAAASVRTRSGSRKAAPRPHAGGRAPRARREKYRSRREVGPPASRAGGPISCRNAVFTARS